MGEDSVCVDGDSWQDSIQGTSCDARFGLDIGGTLCKLVVFEPLVGNKAVVDSNGGAESPVQVGESFHAGQPRELHQLDGDASMAARQEPGKGGSILTQRNGSCRECYGYSAADRCNAAAAVTVVGCFGPGRQSKCSPEAHSSGPGISGAEALQPRNGNEAITSLHASREGSSSKAVMAQATRDDASGEEPAESSSSRARTLWMASHAPIVLPGRGTLHFKRFETWRMEDFLSLAREHALVGADHVIGATGGGARKFGDQFLKIAGLKLQRADELTCLIRGIDFLARHAERDCFEYPGDMHQGGPGGIQRPWHSPATSSDDEDEEGRTGGSSPASLLPPVPAGQRPAGGSPPEGAEGLAAAAFGSKSVGPEAVELLQAGGCGRREGCACLREDFLRAAAVPGTAGGGAPPGVVPPAPQSMETGVIGGDQRGSNDLVQSSGPVGGGAGPAEFSRSKSGTGAGRCWEPQGPEQEEPTSWEKEVVSQQGPGRRTREGGACRPSAPGVAATGFAGEAGAGASHHPYLVVNIGSGVSILRVDSADAFERVGGSSLGGSTFLGLASVLTGCSSFKEAIELASRGDSSKVDMLVGDIYGGDYTEMGLAATTVASSFGKLAQAGGRAGAVASAENLAKAALLMVTNNVGSLAMLHARPAGVRCVLFTGSFLHHNKLALRLLAVAVDFWSKGQMKAVFMQHEGHAGAVGALLSAMCPSVGP